MRINAACVGLVCTLALTAAGVAQAQSKDNAHSGASVNQIIDQFDAEMRT
jgi:hypothetical protein